MNPLVSVKRFRSVLPAVLILAPVVLVALFIYLYGVNVPVGDEWHLARDLRAVELREVRFSDLWRQHNEHRMLFPRAALIVLAKLSGWNTIVEMYASYVLLLLMLLVWWRLYRRTCSGGGLWRFVPLAWLICSLGQWENMLTGWQLQFFLGTLAMVWAMLLLPSGSWGSLAVAALSGIVASFSFNHGLVIWPVGFIGLALVRANKARLIAWAVVGVLVTAVYYSGYVLPPAHPSPWKAFLHPFQTLAYFVLVAGAPLASGDRSTAAAMGSLFIAILIAELFRRSVGQGFSLAERLPRLSPTDATLVALLMLSVLSSLGIAVGRVGFHQWDWATSSRYVTMSSIGVAAAYLMFLKPREASVVAVAAGGPGKAQALPHRDHVDLSSMLLALVLVGGATAVPWGFEAGRNWYGSRLKAKYAVQTFALQPDKAFEHTDTRDAVREYGPFLQARGWSVFRDPVTILALRSFDKGLPVGEILPDRPVVQALTCQVTRLADFQLLFATYGRVNTSTVTVTLAEGGRAIVRRSFSAAVLKDNGWATIGLPSPVDPCAGRDLLLTVTSPDATPGNAITIWSYPRYYTGALVKPDGPAYAGRVLGLSINLESMKVTE